tara:strand:+ start:3920 stop:4111 length:192 start_codon:yes stop_codon:yes gene_type:complete
MGSPVGYTHSRIPALTLMMLMERRSDKTSLVSSEIQVEMRGDEILFVDGITIRGFWKLSQKAI